MTSSKVTLTVSLLLGRRRDFSEVGQFSIVAKTTKRTARNSIEGHLVSNQKVNAFSVFLNYFSLISI